ncbi:uncharacterized protein EV154DRAFT_589811 [Mucor mucedo]|uniref:uncharacterized protein n=1 Tax=Mucor mucedo TaxID=29922 RepID=UPI0022204393|nr:uncharacterized protein EV154DRAFT_589811 [Mucor mucedo]KAI7890645.1 hypothetical protein EV154DRAFT_589811 [Mucor mucedo]
MNSSVNANHPAAAQGSPVLDVNYSSSSESECSGGSSGSEAGSGSDSDVVHRGGDDSDRMDVDVEGTPENTRTDQGEASSSTVSPVVDSSEGSDYAGRIAVLQNRIKEDAATIDILSNAGTELMAKLATNPLEYKVHLDANSTALEYLHKRTANDRASLISLRNEETNLLEVTSRTDKLTIKKSRKELDHTAINPKDLPPFNVRPTKARKAAHIENGNEDYLLETFVISFERVYKNANVDVQKHWFVHLEGCLEKHFIYRAWFNKAIKPKHSANKKLTWTTAVKILQERFVIYSDKGIQKDNEELFENGAIKDSENLAAYMFSFGILEITGNVSTKNNYLYTACFIWNLKNEKLKAKVIDAMSEYMNLSHKDTSIHAPCNDEAFCDFYSDFENVRQAITRKLALLEQCLEDERKKGNANSSSGSSSEKSKKRKAVNGAGVTPPWSSPSSSSSSAAAAPPASSSSGPTREINFDLVRLDLVSKPSHVLNSEEKNFLFKAKKCIYCRVATFSVGHAEVCPEKKKQYKVNNNSIHDNNNNLASSNVNVLSNQLNNDQSNSNSSDVSRNTKNYDTDEEENFGDDEDDFQAAYRSLDDFICNDNDEVDSFNKNIFAIKINNDRNVFINKGKSLKGSDDLFNSESVAYSPITPIIINSVKTYCTLDTGAQVSIIDKQFAIDHNIQFHHCETFYRSNFLKKNEKVRPAVTVQKLDRLYKKSVAFLDRFCKKSVAFLDRY